MAQLAHLKTILIVEDEALILMDLEQTLLDAGVEQVLSAVSADAAVQLVDSASPDAAVLDLHLGRSGWSYDVARRLKEKGIPFIFSSGSADVADGFGNVPLIGKPFSAGELIATLLDVTSKAPANTAQ